MGGFTRFGSWFATVLLVASACGPEARAQTATGFDGARLITGEGTVIENSAVVVEGSLITAVGRQGEVTVPAGAARVDLAGKTMMPAIIDAHVHMGYRKGVNF